MKLIEALRAYTKIVQAKLDATILHSHNLTKGEAREEVIREGFLRQFYQNRRALPASKHTSSPST